MTLLELLSSYYIERFFTLNVGIILIMLSIIKGEYVWYILFYGVYKWFIHLYNSSIYLLTIITS